MRRRTLLAAAGTSVLAGCTSIGGADMRGARVVNDSEEEISVSVQIDRGSEQLRSETVTVPPAEDDQPSAETVPLDESTESGLYTVHGSFDEHTVTVSNGPLDLMDCYFAEFRVTDSGGFSGQRVPDCDELDGD